MTGKTFAYTTLKSVKVFLFLFLKFSGYLEKGHTNVRW